jgi:hypothetical protein
MTKREPLMDQKYFDETIAYMNQASPKFEAKIQEPDIKLDHQKKLLYKLFRDAYELLLTQYSAGYPIAQLRESFPVIVARRERHQKALGRLGTDFAAIDDYVTSLWLVSLGILLDIETPLFERLLACIGNEGRDQLFERLTSTRVQGRPAGAKVMFPKPYQTLYDATITSESEEPKMISAFLNTWYPSLGKLGIYWHDNHKGPKGGGFFGYWCLEAGSVVKAFGIDDSEFRNAQYYPKDFVHSS